MTLGLTYVQRHSLRPLLLRRASCIFELEAPRMCVAMETLGHILESFSRRMLKMSIKYRRFIVVIAGNAITLPRKTQMSKIHFRSLFIGPNFYCAFACTDNFIALSTLCLTHYKSTRNEHKCHIYADSLHYYSLQVNLKCIWHGMANLEFY